MNEKLLNFIINQGSSFFVGSLITKEVLFVNKVAENLFGCTKETCDFEKIFKQRQQRLEDLISNIIHLDHPAVIYNVVATTAKNEHIFVDLCFGFFDEQHTEIFLEINPRGDSNLQAIKHFINQSSKSEALLSLDDKLTILYCNDYFYNLFETNEKDYQKYFKHNIINILPLSSHEIAEVHNALKIANRYTKEIEVILPDEKTKWIEFDFQKRDINDYGDKILCTAVDINERKNARNKLDHLNQYLTAMQEISDDVLFRIDVKTMTLHRIIEREGDQVAGQEIPDYMNVLKNQNIIHPEDALKYYTYSKQWFDGTIDSCSLRFMTKPDHYEWFEVQAKKILDENGDLKEVFGKLVNIDDEVNLKHEYAQLNQYFRAMQNLSEKIIFRIDIKTKTMYHADSHAIAFDVPTEIPNFVDVFIENKLIHPEDIDKYREYTTTLLNGDNIDFEIRSAVDVGVYEYFLVKSSYIYDKNGEPVEIFGTMDNIQWKKDLEQKASHDLMTQVLNKVSFENVVASTLKNSLEIDKHALIFIDLDDFKGVNDNLGHRFGDFLLASVGKRLKRVVRDSDIVGRIGGDEFAVFLKNISSDASAMQRCEVLLEALRREFSFEGNSKVVKASLGVSIYPYHGREYSELLHNSDLALYISKRNGKDTATLYSNDVVNEQ